MQNIILRAVRFFCRKIILKDLKRQYNEILTHLREQNVFIMDEREYYKFYKSSKLKGAIIILRHDVDRNLKNIKVIKQIEKRNKVRSTLHLRAKERTYKLKELKSLDLRGFDIALHLESSSLDEIKKDKMSLEKTVKRKIIGASIHGGYYPGKNISKKKILQNLKKAGFKYITFFNKGNYPIKKYGMLLIPYRISDLEIVQSGYKEFMRQLNDIIKRNGCSSLNTHSEYF